MAITLSHRPRPGKGFALQLVDADPDTRNLQGIVTNALFNDEGAWWGEYFAGRTTGSGLNERFVRPLVADTPYQMAQDINNALAPYETLFEASQSITAGIERVSISITITADNTTITLTA